MLRKCATSWISTYVEYTRFQQAPPRYHVWTALALLASAVSRNVCMERGYYQLYPNLYVVLVGSTGISKTTATDIGINHILSAVPTVTLAKGKITAFWLYDFFGKKTQSQQDCCATIYSAELKNLMENISKTELITMLTELYGCPDSTSYNTKTGGVLSLKNVCINIIASSTPEWLTTGISVNEISGGFTGRFVYIFSSEHRNIAFPEDFVTPDVMALKQDLIDDLRHISTIKGKFVMTAQAKADYTIWYNKRQEEWRDERLMGYYARKGDLVLKLAMLVALSHGDALVIDEATLQITWEMLNRIEKDMGEAFSGVVDDPVLKYKDMIVSQICREPGQRITRSDLLRKNWNRFDGIVLDRIAQNLIEAKMLRCDNQQGVVWYQIIDTL